MSGKGDLPSAAFGSALASLADTSAEPDPVLLDQLSMPTRGDLVLWRSVLPTIPVERRRWLCRSLTEQAEADFAVYYEPLLTVALDDDDAEVRTVAVEGLWESEDPQLCKRFIALVRHDPSVSVRGAAASALAAFVQLAEMQELPTDLTLSLTRTLVDTAADESEEADVRRRATESVGFLDTAEVRALIETHSESDDRLLQAGALVAMGRHGSRRWEAIIVDGLDATDPLLQYAAAQAAGDLGANEAVASLLPLAEGDDLELRLVAIWALGEIGGRQARRALERIGAGTEDDDTLDAVEEALAMVDLIEGDLDFSDLEDVNLLGERGPDRGIDWALVESYADDSGTEGDDLDDAGDGGGPGDP